MLHTSEELLLSLGEYLDGHIKRRLLVIVVRRYVLSSFIDENDISQVHDVIGIVLKILKALLMIGKLGKVVCFNVELTLSGNPFTGFFQ